MPRHYLIVVRRSALARLIEPPTEHVSLLCAHNSMKVATANLDWLKVH